MKVFSGKSLVALLALAALAGCGNVSRQVAKDGQTAGALVWPQISDATPMHKGGTAPTLNSVRNVHAGQSKNQIAALIGFPHFNEGVLGVREWNYVFNFYRASASDVATVCQFKVLFDEYKVARSFYWKPASCATLLTAKTPSDAPVPKMAEQHFNLSADTLFGFDKSSVETASPAGRDALDPLAEQILTMGSKLGEVRVLGYTDRVGSKPYNDKLSRQRADAVKHYLVQRGVPAEAIVAEGHGSEAPVSKSCSDGSRAALIACLAPDRRVEIIVTERD